MQLEPYRSAASVEPSDVETFTESRAIAVVASRAGDVSLEMAAGGTLVVPVSKGLTILPFAATRLNATGTTAAATFARLH